MVNTPYGTHIKSIKDTLKGIIDGTNSFMGRTYVDLIAPMDDRQENPVALITLDSDNFNAIGPHTTYHEVIFHIEVLYLADYTEASMNAMLDYVGEIVDAIEADRGFNDDDIEMIEVLDIDYTWEEYEAMIVRKALIRSQVNAYRNI
jgi:hypothetical protein